MGDASHPLFVTHDVIPLKLTPDPREAKYEIEFHRLCLTRDEVDTVVYHHPCSDGFASAMVAYLYNPTMQFIPVNHSQLRTQGSQLRGKRVAFIDIAPHEDDLAGWEMKQYVILDHHQSAERALANVPPQCKVFDMHRSGVGLAWTFFFGMAVELPLMLQYIQARDLWRQDTLDGCVDFITGLNALTVYCAYEWVSIMNDQHSMMTLITMGGKLEKQRQDRVEAYVRRAVERKIQSVPNVKFYAVNCTDRSCTSDVGAQLARKNPTTAVGLIWCYDGTEKCYWISLRSMDPNGPDVARIAKSYGGGGHRAASGFTFRGNSIEDLFAPTS